MGFLEFGEGGIVADDAIAGDLGHGQDEGEEGKGESHGGVFVYGVCVCVCVCN